jgi:hypothetical protein
VEASKPIHMELTVTDHAVDRQSVSRPPMRRSWPGEPSRFCFVPVENTRECHFLASRNNPAPKIHSPRKIPSIAKYTYT